MIRNYQTVVIRGWDLSLLLAGHDAGQYFKVGLAESHYRTYIYKVLGIKAYRVTLQVTNPT